MNAARNTIHSFAGVGIRQQFDPSNHAHQKAYYNYLTTKRWGEIQFALENPYTSVPEMVAHKFAMHMLTREFANHNSQE